jgi:hypothetical protein
VIDGNPESIATSFQINVTCRCSTFGWRWSDPSRTAATKASIVASLTSSGSIPLALA